MRLPSGMKLVNSLCGWWTVLVFAFLYLPIFVVIAYSFNKSRLNLEWTGFTLEWYAVVFRPEEDGSDNPLMKTLKNSLYIATWVTLISTVMGTVGAWLLHRFRYRFQRLWETLLFIPMAVPEIILGVSFLLLFVLAAPWVNGALDAVLGVSDEQRFGLGFLTVILSHVTFCFPFVLISVQARLADVDPHLEEAALDLGATPVGAFWRVMLPYMMPAVVSGALMAFTLSMDEVIVTYFVSGPESKTLQLEIFDHVRKGINPSLNAVSSIFIVATAVLVVIAERIRKLNR